MELYDALLISNVREHKNDTNLDERIVLHSVGGTVRCSIVATSWLPKPDIYTIGHDIVHVSITLQTETAHPNWYTA